MFQKIEIPTNLQRALCGFQVIANRGKWSLVDLVDGFVDHVSCMVAFLLTWGILPGYEKEKNIQVWVMYSLSYELWNIMEKYIRSQKFSTIARLS